MFSYEDYREILSIIKNSGKYVKKYEDALGKDKFAIMRNDVEYSVERAYDLAKVETSMDFISTFFFQWTNNSYNILSRKNITMLRDMHERGHEIGLHFALNGMTDMDLIRKQIKKEIDMLSEMIGFEIKQFSIHRPSQDALRENIKIPGIINAYQDDFFTFAENVTNDSELPIKYMSDANHIWRYGYPDKENIENHDKVQILTHPFAWCKQGYDNFDNYKALVNEKYEVLIDSIDAECKDFGEYKDYFLGVRPVE